MKHAPRTAIARLRTQCAQSTMRSTKGSQGGPDCPTRRHAYVALQLRPPACERSRSQRRFVKAGLPDRRCQPDHGTHSNRESVAIQHHGADERRLSVSRWQISSRGRSAVRCGGARSQGEVRGRSPEEGTDDYASVAGQPSQDAKTQAAARNAVEAVLVAEQTLAGQYWTDPGIPERR